MTEMDRIGPDRLEHWLVTLLDCIDYTRANCMPTQPVGTVLPQEVIDGARRALQAYQEQDRQLIGHRLKGHSQ
jgi:hypothetical protein